MFLGREKICQHLAGMEQIRQGFLEQEQTVDANGRAVLLQVTNTFERIVWMTQRLARLLDRRGRTPVAEPATSAAPEEGLAGAII